MSSPIKHLGSSLYAITAVFTTFISTATAARPVNPVASIGFPNAPEAPWDPETIATCATWQDVWPHENTTATSCDAVRSEWDISPEQFHEFNPSVAPNAECQGWKLPGSYCVADEKRDREFWQTVTHHAWTSRRPTFTTSAPGRAVTVDGTPVPSPRAWAAMGCYSDPESSSSTDGKILKDMVNYEKPDREVKLTLDVCREACWARFSGKASFYSGVKDGRECWCGRELLVGEGIGVSGWGIMKMCPVPCPGNAEQTCGGEGRMAVYKAVVIYGTGLQWGMEPTSTMPGGEVEPTGDGAGSGTEQNMARKWTDGCGTISGVLTSLAVILLSL